MRSSCPVVKENTTVVMEREDYDRKVRELLDDTYLPQTTKGPTPTQESKISRKRKEITAKLYNRLRPSGSQLLRYVAYPKFTRNPSLLGPLFHALDHPPTSFPTSLPLRERLAPMF